MLIRCEQAIIIHGMMPHAGTAYVGELLRQPPDLTAFPNRIWETPFLQLSGDIVALQETFLWIHRHNRGKLNEKDFLPFACRRYRRSAGMVLACDERYRQRPGYWLARFEDAVGDPEGFVREACARFDLDVARYPFDEIGALPVRGSSRVKEKGAVTWHPVAKPEDFNPVGRWMSWPAWRKWRFKRIAGQALLDLGYGEDLDW